MLYYLALSSTNFLCNQKPIKTYNLLDLPIEKRDPCSRKINM